MRTDPSVNTSILQEQYAKGLLNIALVLAVVTAIFHEYIGLVIYGVPLGGPLILISLAY